MRGCVAALAASVGLLAAAPASAFERAVPEQFFGISAPSLYSMSLDGRYELRDRALAEIEAARIDSVRTEAGWVEVEPNPPTAAGHAYTWTKLDRHVEALALHGQTWTPVLHSPPVWARTAAPPESGCRRNSGVAPTAVSDFADFAGALAGRYGRGGAFWTSRPDLPELPVERFEIWNEPNWTYFWCPASDPETFAALLAASAEEIHAADPEATAAMGGLATLKTSEYTGTGIKGMETTRFLERMAAAEPELPSRVDAVAFHVYRPHPDLNLAMLGWVRRALEAVGLGDKELLLTEFGWNQLDYSEADRAKMIARTVDQLARTDCDLAAIYPHTWIGPELNLANREHWWGMADPQTGAPYQSARAYAEQVELYEGEAASAPPSEILPACHGDGSSPTSEAPRVHPPRVPDSFFGAAVTKWPSPWKDQAQFESMGEANLGRARELISWSSIEPVAPDATGYEPGWAPIDDQFILLALEGVSVAPAFHSTPGWAAAAPGGLEGSYARFMGSFAERYGAGGAFWDESRHLDAALAPRRFEIWSLANGSGSWSDGNASASRYASMYVAAREALRAVDPDANAVASLSDTGAGGTAEAFIRDMVGARPELSGNLDAVYVQTTSRRTFATLSALIADVRAALDETGNEDAEVHLAFGAPTGGTGALTEAERAALFAEVADWAPRSDCGIEGLLAYSWTSDQQLLDSIWHWFGIADPAAGTLTDTAVAYRDTAASFTGLSADPAPRATVHTCGRPAPDRDGDGVPDAEEDYPLDPAIYPEPTPDPTPEPDPAPAPASVPQHPAQPGAGADAAAPVIELQRTPRRRSAQRRPRLRFSLSDQSPASAEYRLDRGGWRAARSPLRLARQRPGKHRLELRAGDQWGNVSKPVRVRFRIVAR
ncbi:MAG: hypothetical protein ACRDK9_12905 [Solirubrobacterales bacterium]